MYSNINPKSRQNNLVIQELTDEVLIYDLTRSKAFCLNHTAAFVWQHANGQTPARQIAYLLQKKLRTPVDESIIWFALENLEKDGLMESCVAIPRMFAGMTRRQLIAAAGRSAAVAIPLVFAITVPMPANAASAPPTNQPNGAACTSGSQCASGTCPSGKCCSAGDGGACTTTNDCCVSGQICSTTSHTCITPGGGSGCVLYDTLITAADGQTIKAIDVFVGQQLIGVNCLNGELTAGRVKAKEQLQASEIYSILAESGDTIQCSPSHPLIAGFGDRDGTRIENFQVGDALLAYDKATNRIVEAKTIAVERIKIAQPVILIEMDTFEHTFVSGGIVSHNKIVA